MKPGYKTTEFWLTLFSSILPAIGAMAGVIAPETAAVAGAAVTGVYNAGRALEKSLRGFKAVMSGAGTAKTEAVR